MFMLWALPAMRGNIAIFCASRLARRRRTALAGRRFLDGPARLGLWARGRHRNHRADGGLLGAGPGPLLHHRLECRGRAHGRALRPVRHHRARRIGPGHRANVCRPDWNAATWRHSSVAFAGSVAMWWFISTSTPSAAAVNCGAPTIRPHRAKCLHLSAHPDRRRHHRRRGGRRARAAPSRRPHRCENRGRHPRRAGALSARQRAVQGAVRALFPLSHMVGLGLLALLIPAAVVATPLLLAAITTSCWLSS